MKHKIIQKTLMLLAAVVLLAACSKSTDAGAYIPNNAMIVANIDMGTMMQKADVKNIDNISFVKLVRQELRSENPEIADLLDKIIEDPTATGLDLRKDVTVYATKNVQVAFIATMHNTSKFEKFMHQVVDDIVFEEKDGFNQAITDVGTIFYNKDVAILSMSSEGNLPSTINLSRDESLASNKNFVNYWKNRSEISLWMDYGAIIDFAEQFGGADITQEMVFPEDYWNDIRNSSISCNLIFDKGAFRGEMTVLGFDNKKWKDYDKKFNSDLLKLMPEKSYAFFSLAFNPDKVAESFASMDMEDVDFNEPIVGDMSLADIMKALEGSIAFSLFDFVENEQTTVMPLMAIAADVKDEAAIKQIIDEAGMKSHSGYYYYELGKGINIYVAMNKGSLYITNSEEAVTKFVSGGYGKGINHDIASKAKNNVYLYANLDVDTYPKALVSLMPRNLAHLLGGYFESLEFYASDWNTAKGAAYIKNKKENSLLATLHFVDNNIMELINLTSSIENESDCPVYTEEYYVDEESDTEWNCYE